MSSRAHQHSNSRARHPIVRLVGEQLNVGAVLEGSVRKSGTRLRVTAQLINVADGFYVWSERYDREMADVFEIQDDIARRIVDALRVKLPNIQRPHGSFVHQEGARDMSVRPGPKSGYPTIFWMSPAKGAIPEASRFALIACKSGRAP